METPCTKVVIGENTAKWKTVQYFLGLLHNNIIPQARALIDPFLTTEEELYICRWIA